MTNRGGERQADGGWQSPAIVWPVLGGLVAAASFTLGAARLPSPVLFAAFAVGIGYALSTGAQRAPGRPLVASAQALIGITSGAYMHSSTLRVVAADWGPVVLVTGTTLTLSVVLGLVFARVARIDRATAAFGMIAGGASGIVAISRELGADDRLVAVIQYVRVLLVVSLMPIVSLFVFGVSDRSGLAATHQPSFRMGLAFVLVCVTGGMPLARLLRMPAGALIGPMLVAAILALSGSGLAVGVPSLLDDFAFAVIGLQVGLRFSPRSLRNARSILPAAGCFIATMLVLSALLGLALSELAHVSRFDAYLATTPGGLPAVLAFAIGARSNAALVVAVQVLRTFVMLLAAPWLARWLAGRPTTAIHSPLA